MDKFNFHKKKSENILDSTTSEDILETSINQDLSIYDKKRYFVYVGNFGGLAGLNTAVYMFFNRYHNKYYIGQTINLQARLNTHFQCLNKNIHKNKEFQKDYNEIIDKDLDPKQEIQGSIIFREFHERINTEQEILDIINFLVKLESKEIARLIENGEKIYNLDGLRGIPCIIEKHFYPSLDSAREALGIGISQDQIKVNLSDSNKPDWEYAREKDIVDIIPSTGSSKKNRPIKFTNPFTNEVVILNSLNACEKYLKRHFNKEKAELRKLNIPISRKRIQQSCSENRCKYITFAEKTN